MMLALIPESIRFVMRIGYVTFRIADLDYFFGLLAGPLTCKTPQQAQNTRFGDSDRYGWTC